MTGNNEPNGRKPIYKGSPTDPQAQNFASAGETPAEQSQFPSAQRSEASSPRSSAWPALSDLDLNHRGSPTHPINSLNMGSLSDTSPWLIRSEVIDRTPGGNIRDTPQPDSSQREEHGGRQQTVSATTPALSDLRGPTYTYEPALEQVPHEYRRPHPPSYQSPHLAPRPYQPPPPYQYFSAPSDDFNPSTNPRNPFTNLPTLDNGGFGTLHPPATDAAHQDPARTAYYVDYPQLRPFQPPSRARNPENHGASVNPWTNVGIDGFGSGSTASLPQGGRGAGGSAPGAHQWNEGYAPRDRRNNAYGGGRDRGRGRRGARGGRPRRLPPPSLAPLPTMAPYGSVYGEPMRPFPPPYPQPTSYGTSPGLNHLSAGSPSTSVGFPPLPCFAHGPPGPPHYPYAPNTGYQPFTRYPNSSYPPPSPHYPPIQGAYGPHARGQPHTLYSPPPGGVRSGLGYGPHADPRYGPRYTYSPSLRRPNPSPAIYPVTHPRFVSEFGLRPASAHSAWSATASAPEEPPPSISSAAPQHFVPSGEVAGDAEGQTQGDTVEEGNNVDEEEHADGEEHAEGDGDGGEGPGGK